MTRQKFAFGCIRKFEYISVMRLENSCTVNALTSLSTKVSGVTEPLGSAIFNTYYVLPYLYF